MSIENVEYRNGFKLVYQKNKFSETTTINIFVKVGSINEPSHLRGFSHFLEHMVFKGNDKYKTHNEISEHFDSIGAYFNAYTTYDHTCYIVKSNSDYFEKNIDILSHMLLKSIFKKDEFHREKTVVVDEINRIRDNNEEYVNEKIYEILFNGSSYQNSIGGDEHQIMKYNILSGKKYYKEFYQPHNMVLSICSNLDMDQILSILENNLLVITKSNKISMSKNVPRYKIDKYIGRRIGILKRPNLEQTYIALGFKVCGKNDKDYYALNLLRIILAGNMSSILFINLREKEGITYSIHIDTSFFKEFGCFVILTGVDNSKFIGTNDNGALDVIIKSLNFVKSGQLTQNNLDIAKGYLKGTLSLTNDDTLNVTSYNGLNNLFDLKDKTVNCRNLFTKRYESITLSDINRIIKKYISKKTMSSYYIGSNINQNVYNHIVNIENKLI